MGRGASGTELMLTRGELEKQIAGQLQACIDAHGPITAEWKGSASKRIIALLKQHRLLAEQRSLMRDTPCQNRQPPEEHEPASENGYHYCLRCGHSLTPEGYDAVERES